MNPAVREHLDYIIDIIGNADLPGDDLRAFYHGLIDELHKLLEPAPANLKPQDVTPEAAR